MAGLARPGAQDTGHEEADLGRREELTGALARTLSELPQQVLVGAAEEVRLDVGQAEAVARVGEGLDHPAQLGRVDVALAVALSCEVDHVDDARQARVVADDGTHRLGQVLPDVLRGSRAATVIEGPVVRFPPGDDTPTRLLREVEAQKLVVLLGDLESDLAVPVLLGQPGDLVVEDVREALQEQQRQQVVLELGRVLLAADRARGVPEHLLHGLGGHSADSGTTPPSGSDGPERDQFHRRHRHLLPRPTRGCLPSLFFAAWCCRHHPPSDSRSRRTRQAAPRARPE